jgi:hypothetical protein
MHSRVRTLSRSTVRLTLVALAAATALVVQLVQPSAHAGVASTTLIGAAMGQHGNENFAAAVHRGNNLFGKLHALRVYHGGGPRPWSAIMDATQGAPAIVSFREKPGVILSGSKDAFYRAWFASAPTSHIDYWTYIHEPEDDIERHKFTAADYRAAFNHLANLAHQAHNGSLKSTLLLMGFTLTPYSHRSFSDYYAGSSAVDSIGYDIYNGAQGQPRAYEDPSSFFREILAKAAQTGKPWGLGEFNSKLVHGDHGAGRAAWLAHIGAYAEAHHAAFLLLFNSNHKSNWELRDSASINAWKHVNLTS